MKRNPQVALATLGCNATIASAYADSMKWPPLATMLERHEPRPLEKVSLFSKDLTKYDLDALAKAARKRERKASRKLSPPGSQPERV
ncbi:MAG TPA: hypothetical protein VD994_14995 [Prosthecobacter sp.]|nr:hypothetical protein [Prosthecobacter sp.]